MPYRPDTPCKHPGCGRLVPYGTDYCEQHAQEHKADRASAAGRGYDSRWRKVRRLYLATHPLCVRCMEEGVYRKATVVDHIVPHRGDQTLFWDENNWQPLCKHHHDVKTMTEDRYQEYRF